MAWLIISALITLIILALLGYGYATSVLPQSAYHHLPRVPSPQPTDRVLVITPHQDDETAAAGGFILAAVNAGAACRVILASNGDFIGQGKQRDGEFRQALARLQVSPNQLVMLGLPDGHLKRERTRLQQLLAREIQDFAPTIIIGPHPRDIHPDHALIGTLVVSLTADSPTARVYQYLVHYWFFPQPSFLARQNYLLPPWRLIRQAHDFLAFPVTAEHLQAKEAALEEYRTQLHNLLVSPLLKRMLRRNELFEVVRQDRE